MKRKEARAFINSLIKLRISATDTQASNAPAVYPTWKEEVDYKVDERIVYNNILYKVLIEHTSQATWTPDVSPSLFSEVLIPDEEVIYDWKQPDSTNTYSKGDKVKHNGKIWISDYDNNSWEPGVYGWSEITE